MILKLKMFNFENNLEYNQLRQLVKNYFTEIDGKEMLDKNVENYINNVKNNLKKYATLVLIVAVEDDKIIGLLFGNTNYYYNEESCGFILELFTTKNFRYKSVGRSMVNYFESLCLDQNVVYLTSAPNSTKFFERIGYNDTEILDKENNISIFKKKIN